MPVEISKKILTTDQIVAKLNAIHDDVQAKFHDQWDWMDAAFYVECLRCRIEDLEAKLAALDYWTPITPENSPPLGKQVDAYTNEGEVFKVHRELEELADDDMREPQSYYWSDYADQEIHGVTHFRSHNAPAAHPGGQGDVK